MRVNAKICFYKFKPLQGWRYSFIRVLTNAKHTHAHLEFSTEPPIAVLVIDGKAAEVFKVATLDKTGIQKYYEFDLGELELSSSDFQFFQTYKNISAIKMIFYYCIGRFFGMKKPASCVTFICDYLKFKGWNIPDLFSPKELWENLHASDNARWSGPRGQNNTSQVAQ
jgi:hypothetical protein